MLLQLDLQQHILLLQAHWLKCLVLLVLLLRQIKITSLLKFRHTLRPTNNTTFSLFPFRPIKVLGKVVNHPPQMKEVCDFN